MTTGDLYLELSTNINRPPETHRLWCEGIGRLKGELGFQWHRGCSSKMSADVVNWEWLGLSASWFPEFGAHIIVVCNPERLCSFISMKRSEKRDLRLRLPQATQSRLNFPFQGICWLLLWLVLFGLDGMSRSPVWFFCYMIDWLRLIILSEL